MTRPVSVPPAESRVVAVNDAVPPTTIVAEAGATMTEATGTTTTVSADVSALPSLVAIMDAEPAATPVATPELVTVATPVFVDVQEMTRPVNVPPAESRVVAVNEAVPPTAILAVAGVTVTDATGTTITVRTDVSAFVSLVAMMETEPAATPLATPEPFTVAIAVFVDRQVTTRPFSTLPDASRIVALKDCVPPMPIVAVAGASVTEATATELTVREDVSLTPSLVAIIEVVPLASALATPEASIVATLGAVDLQVTTRPVTVLPSESRRFTL
jgi:hypothetical protein